MTALKIIESVRQSLTDAGVVICTMIDLQDNQVDCIDVSYKSDYPDFTEIEVQKSNEF